MHSAAIRHLHMAMRYYHQADQPPSMLYVTDGGVQDCTGILQLLQRRSERILLALAAADPDDDLAVLRTTMRIATRDKVASFYDPEDPRVNVFSMFDEFKEDTSRTTLILGIRYGWHRQSAEEGHVRRTGRLFVVKNRLPPQFQALHPEPLLSKEEIVGSGRSRSEEELPLPARWEEKELHQEDLAGCCCDCCHTAGCCNIGPGFPHVSNANQCLTPQLYSSLCHLGYRLSEDAVKAISKNEPLEDSWENLLNR
eukprot:TRINITY_DN30042_c0_g1_i1.p1 TRINITY_DN30042_c0_g1~~TRINITY_DN30042_c0_g1_i1.p1  ORF type:complete len:254 (-),score=31.69 TRINITY_DN30042_c0_g1_i1:31-792(-)